MEEQIRNEKDILIKENMPVADIKFEEKEQPASSNIDRLLSKYLGANDGRDDMSLEMRVRARISDGKDNNFSESYMAAKQEMEKSKNNSYIYDDLDFL